MLSLILCFYPFLYSFVQSFNTAYRTSSKYLALFGGTEDTMVNKIQGHTFNKVHFRYIFRLCVCVCVCMGVCACVLFGEVCVKKMNKTISENKCYEGNKTG